MVIVCNRSLFNKYGWMAFVCYFENSKGTSMRKELGRIKSFDIGLGGYDGAMFGMSVTLGGTSWGVDDFDGTWAREPDQHCKWTLEDQTKHWGEMCRRVTELMKKAKVTTCADMVGVPVEITFSGNKLESWRILEEVL